MIVSPPADDELTNSTKKFPFLFSFFCFFFLHFVPFRCFLSLSLSLSFLVILWFEFETLDACTHTHREEIGNSAEKQEGRQSIELKGETNEKKRQE